MAWGGQCRWVGGGRGDGDSWLLRCMQGGEAEFSCGHVRHWMSDCLALKLACLKHCRCMYPQLLAHDAREVARQEQQQQQQQGARQGTFGPLSRETCGQFAEGLAAYMAGPDSEVTASDACSLLQVGGCLGLLPQSSVMSECRPVFVGGARVWYSCCFKCSTSCI